MTYQIIVKLLGVDSPVVWRRLIISPEMSLFDLHKTIQLAMGWTDSHPHCFSTKSADGEVEIIPSCDERGRGLDVRIKKHLSSDHPTLYYIYDFGDYWEHEITIERVMMDVTAIPECTAGEGACPPEDCGGPAGYAELKASGESELPDPAEFSAEKANDAIVAYFVSGMIGN